MKTAKKPSESIARAGLTRIHVVLQGIAPGLLMAGKGIMEADAGKTGTRSVTRTREEEANLLAHWMDFEGKHVLAVPFVNLYKSFCKAADRFKKIAKMSASDLLASSLSCPTDKIPLRDLNGNPTDDYEVYAEWVRIPPRTGPMVKIGRPRIRDWTLDFMMDLDTEFLSSEAVKSIVVIAGKTVGIGPWRPQLKGPYGKFTVKMFETTS